MDYVAEDSPHYQALEQIDLIEPDLYLVNKLREELFSDRRARFMVLARGYDRDTVKLIMKPHKLFPLMVKLGTADAIAREVAGWNILRYRTPFLNIPPLIRSDEIGTRGLAAYQYVTGGRVKHVVGRLDSTLPFLRESEGNEVLRTVFDVVLKKCHWQDGDFELKPIILPAKDDWDPLIQHAGASEPLKLFDSMSKRAATCRAPHGITHGDLHPKNVLLVQRTWPVLIDFTHVQEHSCIYFDFAKLEAYLPFQVDGNKHPKYIGEFTPRRDRLYSTDILALPRCGSGLVPHINQVRYLLWKTCMRRTCGLSAQEVDLGYRTILAFLLLRFALHKAVELRASNIGEQHRAGSRSNLESALSQITSLCSQS